MAEVNRSEDRDGEFCDLKMVVPGRVTVIRNVSDIWRVVNIHPHDLDIAIKFQLTKLYPLEPPEILITSSNLSTQEISDLRDKVKGHSKDLLGDRMLLTLYNFLLDNLDSERLQVSTKPKNRKVYKSKSKKIEDQVCEKLVSMKTAMDVINRIQWDSLLDPGEFIVGYLDRFVGVVEKYFTAFSWEDLATVDYTALAIPKHRIQYFKYKMVKVWDKKMKLDNVFGSLGSGVTIYDVINGYKEESVTCSRVVNSESETDSDSDDGITVTIGNTRTNNTTYDDTEIPHNVVNNMADDEDGFWENKLRPNYFLAIRVTDATIHDGVSAVHDHVTQNDGEYSSCCVARELLHITLCTIRLDTPAIISEAVTALSRARRELCDIVSNSKALQLSEVELFGDRVMYVKVIYPQDLIKLVDYVQLLLNECGIPFRDVHDFIPHMTIMKVSRPFGREHREKRKLDSWLYSGYEECKFGDQPIDCIHLCEMGQARREDGFYITATSVDLLDKD